MLQKKKMNSSEVETDDVVGRAWLKADAKIDKKLSSVLIATRYNV